MVSLTSEPFAIAERITALSWLRARVPPESEHPLAIAMYAESEFQLLWSLIERPEDGPQPSSVWLMRAAAYLDEWPENREHLEELMEYFSRTPRDDYQLMGGHLMGLVPEADLLRVATTPQRRCEVAYYLGVKAHRDGRTQDALTWFRVALETNQQRDGEYHWARDLIWGIVNHDRSMAFMEGKGGPLPVSEWR
jgi:hypothetical protein